MTRGRRDRSVGVRSMLVWSVVIVVVLIVLGAGVFALGALEDRGGSGKEAAVLSEDLPAFVNRSPGTLAGYRLAMEQPDLLDGLPCYCGCVALPEDPHRSLLDCYLNEDGSFDAHASGCAICLDIARDAGEWSAEGRSLQEVRSLVEAKYGEIGPSTDDSS